MRLSCPSCPIICLKNYLLPLISALSILTVSPVFAEAETSPRIYMLDTLIKPEAFQQGGKEALLNSLEGGPFRWLSDEKNELRGAGSRMSYHNLPVLEVVFRFKDGQLSEAFLSLYNRGDAGRISDETFDDFVTRTEEKLKTLTSTDAEDLGDPFKNSSIRSQSKAWIGKDLSYRLDTAYSRVREDGSNRRNERPEFVNLTILGGGLERESLMARRKADTGLVNFSERVKKSDDGDVLIEGIPMVDQGQKGYCAVATMERVLRYYGSEVNQHELAQQADSSGQGGTDPESLVKALRGMSNKVGLRVNERITFDSKDFFDFVDDYNRAAKRNDRNEISLPQTGVVMVNNIYDQMEFNIIREVKLKKTSKVDKFFGDTAESIGQGRPLAWAVHLGWVEETPKLNQSRGGHMRLIIGYNETKKELLYSDSWGYGHELKRMGLEDAYSITKGLYIIEPKS